MAQYGFGALPSPYDVRDYTLGAIAKQEQNFPESFDLGVIYIKNQSDKETCLPHTISEIIEYHHVKEGNEYRQFSTDFIYGNRTDEMRLEFEGMYLRDGLSIAMKFGDPPYDIFPGNSTIATAKKKVRRADKQVYDYAFPNRISSYYAIKDANQLKYALYNHGPVAAGMKWFRHARINSKNVYTYPINDDFSGHAVMIAGWTSDCWIVQNSWGKSFADGGRFYIPQSIPLNEIFFDLYGVTDDIVALDLPGPVKKNFGKIFNFIINLINKLRGRH